MHPILKKTFGGLSSQYYLRHLVFGIGIAVLFFAMLSQGTKGIPLFTLLMCIVNTLLYPYSRFVYESVMGYIMGNNVFFVNAILLLLFKLFTMMMCWGFSILIAPVGLLYLYYYHSKS